MDKTLPHMSDFVATGSQGSDTREDSQESGCPALRSLLHKFPHLQDLLRAVETETATKADTPMVVATVEMLEAELTNQGILPGLAIGCMSISQNLAHEMNIWRWKARRIGTAHISLIFEVALPHYILERAEKIALFVAELERQPDTDSRLYFVQSRHTSTVAFNTEEEALSELSYLDAFAAYLTGAFDESENSFQRGLNLILKTLTSRSSESDVTMSADNESIEVRVTLPVSNQHFFRRLKSIAKSFSAWRPQTSLLPPRK